MTLERLEVIAGTEGELRSFADLIAGLDAKEWATATRCGGWAVSDVAGHVTGFASEVVAGRFAELAAPDAPDRQAAERRGRAPKEVAGELCKAVDDLAGLLGALDDAAWEGPAPAGIGGSLGFGVEAIWYDAYVHGDDIRDSLGRSSNRGPGLRAAVSHLAGLLTQQGWGPSTLQLDGLEPFEVGCGGPELRADPLAFVLVATGRAHPVEIGVTEPLNVYPPRP